MIRVIWVKTTVELSDELLSQVRALARSEGTTLRKLMEEGLQRAWDARQAGRPAPLDFPVYGTSGLTREFEGAGWERIREEIYVNRPDALAPEQSGVHDRE